MIEIWLNEQLAPHEEEVVKVAEVRRGSTGAIFAVQGSKYRYYFKTCEAFVRYEPQLTAALDRWFPGYIPAVVGIDAAKSWLLMRDAGPTVRTITQEDGDLSRWEDMLRRYAILQQKAIPYQQELLDLGVADRRLDKLPALYDELIADTDMLMIGQADGISEADLERLNAFGPTVRALCEQAASFKIPETLHHDDFHTNNVSLLDGEFRFFDWAESCVAHPFYSLLMMQRYAKYVFEADQAVLNRMRDAYLEMWQDYDSLARMISLLDITNQLTALCRTLTWRFVVKHADQSYRAELADAVPYWLLTFLNNTPLE
ncbi:MAG TPA: phosphotransferase [Aggregatilineaceae bacterium]|nr:phosphotransferase [Aggregatilineaceae bacterium]